VETFLEGFLDRCRLKYSAESVRAFRWNLLAYGKFLYRTHLDFYKIKKDDVERFLLENGSRQIRRRRLLLIQWLYDYVKQQRPDRFPHENPTASIRIHGWDRRKPPNVPGRAAIEFLCDGLKKTSPYTFLRNRLMLELAYGSGLRRGELAVLSCEDIDYTNKTAQVTGKGGKTRTVPLTKVTVDLLHGYLVDRRYNRGPLLISNNTGRRLTPAGIECVFKKKIGIRPHLLRHACATHMLQNGCNIRVLQELLGHKSISVTQLYTAVDRKDLAKVIDGKHPRKSCMATGENRNENLSSGIR
jgi:site-specific recombinase XerD